MTGTTVGYGNLVTTTGITRVLTTIVAILGIVLTGTVVTIIIEAAKIAIENNVSIQDYRQAVRESTQRRVVRERKCGSRRREEDG